MTALENVNKRRLILYLKKFHTSYIECLVDGILSTNNLLRNNAERIEEDTRSILQTYLPNTVAVKDVFAVPRVGVWVTVEDGALPNSEILWVIKFGGPAPEEVIVDDRKHNPNLLRFDAYIGDIEDGLN
jgi:hypothetical protein